MKVLEAEFFFQFLDGGSLAVLDFTINLIQALALKNFVNALLHLMRSLLIFLRIYLNSRNRLIFEKIHYKLSTLNNCLRCGVDGVNLFSSVVIKRRLS